VVPNHQIPSSRNLGVAASADHCIVFISARINSFDVFSSREDQSVDHSQIGRFVLLNKRLQNMVSIDTKSISAEIEPVENDEPVEKKRLHFILELYWTKLIWVCPLLDFYCYHH
jgi:hypothetical protein